MGEHIRRVVAVINQRHNWNWELDRRCTGGLQGGAWQLVEPGGDKAILKWSARPRFFSRRTSAAVAKVRAAGYPTPAWLAVGRTSNGGYLLMDFVPGEPIEFTVAAARQFIDVIELQAGLAPDLDQDWSTYVATDTDAADYVRELDTDLVRKFQRLRTDVEMPGSDMVHGDFSTCNILAQDGRITGVVDIEALGHGTRAVDYAWLVREVYGTDADPAAADVLRTAGEAVAGPAVFATCVAATALDIVRWVHSRQPESVPHLIDRMHDLADYLAT